MQLLVAPVAMKKNRAPKNAYFHFATINISGILKTSAPNYGTSIMHASKGESIRVFPISNWTELDIWQYIRLENIPIVPLYYAKERPIVEVDGNLIMVDDDRMPKEMAAKAKMRKVRFRTLGCYPLTGAIDSNAENIEEIVEEMMTVTVSERTTRVIDFDQEGSMEQKKGRGIFSIIGNEPRRNCTI